MPYRDEEEYMTRSERREMEVLEQMREYERNKPENVAKRRAHAQEVIRKIREQEIEEMKRLAMFRIVQIKKNVLIQLKNTFNSKINISDNDV